jgi:hypothetical protein
MPTTQVAYLTELALRAAANTTSKELADVGGQIQAMKDVATERLTSGVNSAIEEVKGGSLQTEIIGLAIAGVALGVEALKQQIDVIRDQRLLLNREIEAGIGTFILPDDKEQKDLTSEEKTVKAFLLLAKQYHSFFPYLSIHTTAIQAPAKGKMYAAMQLYRMSEALGQSVPSKKALEQHRASICSFLKTSLPGVLEDIVLGFQTDSKVGAFFESLYEKKNYLNDRRAPRFIIICLANLLWNLQHPVDPITGFPLPLGRCIEICRDVELFINQLLDPTLSPYLETIDTKHNDVITFVTQLEVYVITLREAYTDQQLHALNFTEITNSAHRALRVMDICLYKLIYKTHNQLTKRDEPNAKAAETLGGMITYLNLMLRRSPGLLTSFHPIPQWIGKDQLVNSSPRTIVDVLIIFSHLTHDQREVIYKQILASKYRSSAAFVQELKKLSNQFIQPFKVIAKKELHASITLPRQHEVHCLTARRFIPFMTLLIEDFQLPVDTFVAPHAELSGISVVDTTPILSGFEQAEAINLQAQKGGGYYTWTLAPFLEASTELDVLPVYQYRMTQVTKLVDSVGELVASYRNFLTQKTFQIFLINCLSKVRKEHAVLEQKIKEADDSLEHNEQISRGLLAILRPMTTELNLSLDDLLRATSNFEEVVSEPDFTELQRELLSNKISIIDNKYRELFAEDSGLGVFIIPEVLAAESKAAPRGVPLVASAPSAHPWVDSQQVLALRKLVQFCYDALSYFSREGHKGLLLRKLLEMIDSKTNLTDDLVRHVVMELTRVTTTYRETWFFQAGYGQTRSAQALVSAIKNPNLNKVLPLAAIIFQEREVNISALTDDDILCQFMSLRKSYKQINEPLINMQINQRPFTSSLA